MQEAHCVHDVMDNEKAVVSWSDSADEALGRMRGLGRDRLAVIDAYGVIGLCERSVLLLHQQRGSWLGSISVADLMRRGPFWCRENDPVTKALLAMERLQTDLLAVLDKRGQVIGTVHRSQLEAALRERELAGAGTRH